MRIGIICPNFPPASFEGGIAHYSQNLSKSLFDRGHDVYAFASTEYFNHHPADTHSGAMTIRIDGPWHHSSLKTIRRQFSRLKLDAVILQYAPALYRRSFRFAWAACRLQQQKITAFHTLWGEGIDRLFGIACLAGSHKIIATNSEIISILKRRLPFLLNRTYWVPIGSNIPKCKIGPAPSRDETPFFSYFGMLYPGKGIETILDVIGALSKKKVPIKCKFIGGPFKNSEALERQLRQDIRAKGLEGHIEYLGRIHEEEVSRLLQMSRFIFLPYDRGVSDRRGTLMAALRNGKTVLTTPPAVELPFLKNNVNILWPENVSTEGFVDIIEKLVGNCIRTDRIEKNAIELGNHFRWAHIAESYEMVIGS
jgi:glycosyltransferase involved in cell wall biosynthesis